MCWPSLGTAGAGDRNVQEGWCKWSPRARGAKDGNSGNAALARLQALLQELHQLWAASPEAFRARYLEVTWEVVRLAHAADLSSAAAAGAGEPASALHYAAGCGCLEACEALLDRCGRLHAAADAMGQTPLFWAAQGGLRYTVQLLLRRGDAGGPLGAALGRRGGPRGRGGLSVGGAA